MYDLIIIGGGPAGVTAGIYAARKKLNTLIITKNFGGQVLKAGVIENWPGTEQILGMELIEKMKNHLLKFEIDKKEGEEVIRMNKKTDGNFEVNTTEGNTYSGKAIIITSGTNPRPLRIPGETEFTGKGVSYCDICDAPLFKNKTVAVVGGGNSGFETALEVAKYAKAVYILEGSQKSIADEANQEKVKKVKNIEVILNAKAKQIQGDKLVNSLIYEDNISKTEKKLDVEGIFIAIGQVPVTDFIKELVEFSERGEIKINPKTCGTKTPGLFAAGDATDIIFKQIVIAAGEGAKAALSAYKYLQKQK
jgi:thioredoxin-disulfide reductase